MIEVQAVIPWSAAERPAYEELAIREIHVATRDPRRAVRFYERVFGFRLLGPADANPVVLQATARTDIVLHDVRDPGVEHRGFLDAFGFVVPNLDRARQQAWDLGVEIARDSGAPDQIYRWSNGRSLYVRTPDGNEIELAELWHTAERRYRIIYAGAAARGRIAAPAAYPAARHASG